MNAATTIARWGNSCALRIPSDLLRALQLGPHDRVTLTLENDCLVIKKETTPRKEDLRRFFSVFSDEDYVDFTSALKDTEKIDSDEW